MVGAEPRELALEHLAALAAVLAHVAPLEPGANLGAAPRRGEEALALDEPVAARLRLLAPDDLDHLAVREAVIERDDVAVDAGAAAAMAKLRVHVVREIDRRRAAWQVDDLALGRQRIDAVVKQVRAHARQEVAVALGFRRGRQQLTQPFDLAVIGGVSRRAFLVAPMGSDAELGMLVHVACAYLDFHWHCRRPEHSRVQGAVEIVLRSRDVVVELAGDVVPPAVHDAERGVAVLDRCRDDAHGPNVEDLLEGQVLALHLPPDAVDVLRPPDDFGGDSGAREFLGDLRNHGLDVASRGRRATR